MADNELFAKLQKRNQIIESAAEGEDHATLPSEASPSNNNNEPMLSPKAHAEPQVEGDLASKLQKRNRIIDNDEQGLEPELPSLKVFNPYTEFKEFSRKEIQNYQKMFNQ